METAPRVPDSLAISPGRATAPSSYDDWLTAVSDSGVAAVQLREKHLPDRSLLELARRARSLLAPDCFLFINGRFDVALAAAADGVHLPSNGLPVAAVRSRVGGRLMIGRSTHHQDEVRHARDAGADFVTFGPLRPVPGKESFGPPAGLDGLRRAARIGLPVLALGGIGLDDIEPLREAGVAGIAAIRLFQSAASAAAAVARLRRTDC